MKHKKIAICAVVSLFTLILLISGYVICTVRTVKFDYAAATETTRGEMLAASEKLNAYVGKSVFSVKADKVAASISDNPYVKVVSVKVGFPARLTVKVEERGEAFAVKRNGGYYILDKNTFVLADKRENSARADGLALPCVTFDSAVFQINSSATFSDDTDRVLFESATAILGGFFDARNELSEIVISRYNASGMEWKRIFVYTKEGATFEISEADRLGIEKAELVNTVFGSLTGADRVSGKVEIFTAENDTVDYEIVNNV